VVFTQPELLIRYFKLDRAAFLAQLERLQTPDDFSFQQTKGPDVKLNQLLKALNIKNSYHKVNDGVAILNQLDGQKLLKTDDEFRMLIGCIRSILPKGE
jgi:hypothetical protein